jgi:hypothetical protein
MFGFIEIVVLAIMLALSRGKCPVDWSVNGVRPTGSYECLGPLKPRGCGESAISPPCMRPASSLGRIYCTGGSQPIVIDHRTVGCQARH